MRLDGTAGTITLTYRVVGQSLIFSDSHTIELTPGDAQKIALVQQPGNITAGAAFSPAVTTQVQDAFGNAVSGGVFRTSVKPVLYDTADATSDNSKSAVENTTGAHTWANPGFTKAGTYKLQFTGTATPVAGGSAIALDPAESNIFTIAPAAPSQHAATPRSHAL